MDAARVDAAAVDRELDAAIGALQVLATAPALAADNLRAFHDEAARLQRGYPGCIQCCCSRRRGSSS